MHILYVYPPPAHAYVHPYKHNYYIHKFTTNAFLHVYMQSPRIHTGAVETVRELAQDNQLKVGSLTRLEPF